MFIEPFRNHWDDSESGRAGKGARIQEFLVSYFRFYAKPQSLAAPHSKVSHLLFRCVPTLLILKSGIPNLNSAKTSQGFASNLGTFCMKPWKVFQKPLGACGSITTPIFFRPSIFTTKGSLKCTWRRYCVSCAAGRLSRKAWLYTPSLQ